MKLQEEFLYNPAKYHVILADNLNNTLSEYAKSIIYPTIKLLTNETSFGLIGNSRKDSINLQVSLKRKKRFTINWSSDYIIIFLDGKKYTYTHYQAINKVGINLESINYYNEEQEILEQFLPHKIRVNIRIKNKLFQMEVPIDNQKNIPVEYFSSIKYESTISKLKNIYLKYLSTMQSEYNICKEDTVLNIYELESNTTLRDQIVLRDKKTILYQVNNKTGNIMINVTKKEGEDTLTTITGLTIDDEIYLNKEVYHLIRRGESNLLKDQFKIIK